MRIILGEMKKIWNLKILLIIALLSALYFTTMVGYLARYPRGTWLSDVDFAHHLTENYGTTLEQDDFLDFFLNYYGNIEYELNSFIKSRPIFAEAGIFTMQDYWDFSWDVFMHYDILSEKELNLWYAVSDEWEFSTSDVRRYDGYGGFVSNNELSFAYRRMQNFFDIADRYETRWIEDINAFIEHTPLSGKEAQRLIEIRDSGEMLSIMPAHTIFLTWRYGQSLAVLVILVTFILNSSIITADRTSKVNWLQYSSKQGRPILKKQFIAILISAILMTTILVVVFSGIFSLTEAHAFWNNGINSFLNFPYFWLPITYGQYVFLIVGVIYLLSIGAAAFAFALSRISQSMIRLLFKIIPFFTAVILLSNWVLSEFLAVYLGGSVLIQMLSVVFLLVAGVTIVTVVVHREKKFELY